MSGVEEPGSSVPLFPLPRTVFFPNVDLPLHLFEPRYREMAADVTRGEGDPRIVVVLLRPGWEDDYYGKPPVHDVATLGRVVHHEKLEDGRFNLVLRGTSRVRLDETDLPPAGKLYRCRRVSPLPERRLSFDEACFERAARLEAVGRELWRTSGPDRERQSPPGMDGWGDEVRPDFEQVVNTLCCFQELPPDVKQSLLEEDDLLVRASRLESALVESLRFWRTLARYRELVPEDPRVN